MKNLATGVILGLFLVSVMACGLIDRFTSGGQKMNKVGTLWSDVPPMDGMSPSETELPIGVKLILRTIIGNMGRLNKEGEDRSTGDIDWTSFSGDKAPADVESFYTNDRMTSFGNWETNKNPSCVDAKDKGVNGVLCVYSKKVDKRPVGLVIFAMRNDDTKKTDIYYLRLEADQPDTAKSPSQ